MTRRRLAVMVGLLVSAAGLGGCPNDESADPTSDTDGTTAPSDTGGTEPGDAADDPNATAQKVETLRELASALAESEGGADLAWSEGYIWVSTAPAHDPREVHPPGFNPFDEENSGGSAGGGDVTGGSSGDTAGGTGGGQLTDLLGTLYHGSVDCLRRERLADHAEISENLRSSVVISVDGDGVPFSVPVPMFVTQEIIRGEACLPGDSEARQLMFSGDAAFDVTLSVVDAGYAPESAELRLQIDVSWVGQRSSITASGTHRLSTRRVNDTLTYSSNTHYDARFVADDTWEGRATEDFALSGTLGHD